MTPGCSLATNETSIYPSLAEWIISMFATCPTRLLRCSCTTGNSPLRATTGQPCLASPCLEKTACGYRTMDVHLSRSSVSMTQQFTYCG